MVKNKILIALIFLLVGSIPAIAQKNNSYSIGLSFEGSYYSFSNLNEINNRLNLYHYPTVQNNAAAFSFGVIFSDTSHRVCELIELGGVLPDTRLSNNTQVSFSELRAMFTLNFNINCEPGNRKRILTGPLVGIGVSSAKLTIVDKSTLPKTFDSSLISLNGQRVVGSTNVLLLNLGWAAQKSLTKNQRCSLELRAGYDLALNHPEWQLNLTNLTDNPKTNLSGFYASLQLNFLFNYYN